MECVKMRIVFRILIFIVVATVNVHGQNYCSANLCTTGRHIACGNNGAFGSQCPRSARTVDLSNSRSLILQMHNVRRNRVAGGNLSGYSPAQRMMELTWDNELARIALLNAKRCFMAHDKCRNTQRFQRSGQNIMTSSTRGMPNRLRNHIISGIVDWFSEFNDANMNIINSFSSPKTVGHFTTMVSDRQTKIGCGTVRYVKNGRNFLLTTCNYAATNIFNRPVYRAGTAGSGCTSGRSSRFPNLCSTSEPINPNTV